MDITNTVVVRKRSDKQPMRVSAEWLVAPFYHYSITASLGICCLSWETETKRQKLKDCVYRSLGRQKVYKNFQRFRPQIC